MRPTQADHAARGLDVSGYDRDNRCGYCSAPQGRRHNPRCRNDPTNESWPPMHPETRMGSLANDQERRVFGPREQRTAPPPPTVPDIAISGELHEGGGNMEGAKPERDVSALETEIDDLRADLDRTKNRLAIALRATAENIWRVYCWDNGMLMVFDKSGQQIPQWQGPVEEIGELLAEVFPREKWIHGNWNETHRARPI